MANSEIPAALRRNAMTAVIAAALLAPVTSHAQENSVEERQRQALRQVTAQLRALQDQNATLQAKQTESDRQLAALKAQLADATQQLDALHKAGVSTPEQEIQLRQSLNDTTNELSTTKQTLTATQAALDKWQAAYKQVVDVARTRDGDAKRFEAQLGVTTKRAELCETKNGELFKLGNEILTMYENKGPLTGLLEREPVLQLKRVELENLVQDYQDKLAAQKIPVPTPGPTPVAAPAH